MNYLKYVKTTPLADNIRVLGKPLQLQEDDRIISHEDLMRHIAE